MKAQWRTSAPDFSGARRRYLGQLGPVSGTKYSFTVPGGCEQATTTIACDPRLRIEALNPGRYVELVLGGSVVWDGILDEPAQGDSGWEITAHGSGTFGSQYNADFTAWTTDAPDTIIGNAVSRGLNWLPSSIGHPAGMFLGQPPDPGSVKVDDMLNQLCSLGGLTWWVKRLSRGNLVQVFTLPTAPTRLLVANQPAARTLGGDFNAIEIRYQATPDLPNNPATFATTYATDPDSITRHGRNEAYLDLSNVGPMLAADAQAVGNSVLARYKRASYAGPFTITQGQLLTMGGQPVHLGCYFQGVEGPMVCKAMLTDQAWGGEVTPGPATFLVGRYEYDEDAQAAAITPFQTMREDFSALLSSRASQAHRHKIIKYRVGTDIYWRFAGTRKWHIAHHAADLPGSGGPGKHHRPPGHGHGWHHKHRHHRGR